MLRNQSAQVNIDNSNASKFNIKLIPQWIRREYSKLGNYYSRIKDTENWSIDNDSFRLINSLYGSFTVNRFANSLMFQLKILLPCDIYVNAFMDDWSDDLNWLCPPIWSIGSEIRHLKFCKAKGTLLVRVWRSSYIQLLIYPNGKQMANFIKDFIIVEPFHY